MLVAQLCPTLCNHMEYSPPGSSVQGILQANILKWAAISSSRGNYHTIALISQASKVMLKILQAGRQQYVNHELPDVQAGFR